MFQISPELFHIIVYNVLLPLVVSVLGVIATTLITTRFLWPREEKLERERFFAKRKLEALEKIKDATGESFVVYREGDQVFREKKGPFDYELVKRSHLEPLHTAMGEIADFCALAFDSLSDVLILFNRVREDLVALTDKESVIEEGTASFSELVSTVMYDSHKLSQLATESLQRMNPLSQLPRTEPVQHRSYKGWVATYIKTQFGHSVIISDYKLIRKKGGPTSPFVWTLIGHIQIPKLLRPVRIMLLNLSPYQPYHFCKRLTRKEYDYLRKEITKILKAQITNSS